MKTLLYKLKQIKHICEQHETCAECVFCRNKVDCEIKDIVYLLCSKPSKWNIDVIEKIIGDKKK